MDPKYSSLLNYYQENYFNPVPIKVEDKDVWKSHKEKRRNLYENHLMVPLSLLEGREVLEFGCNSGENALYLATLGANLTLVEPNTQVSPRLKHLFGMFGVEKRIREFVNKDIGGFSSGKKYDLVIAECFLNQLADSDQMFLGACGFIKQHGLGIISFDDLYGSFLEIIRQLILKRVCQLKGVQDIHSRDSLIIANELYGQDFKKINASRAFEAWWKDVLVSPFVNRDYFWDYHRLIALLEKAGCKFHSSSPRWTLTDRFCWYKNVSSAEARHRQILDEWYKFFAFFLTGIILKEGEAKPADKSVVNSVSNLIKEISCYMAGNSVNVDSVMYPLQLDDYLGSFGNKTVSDFNAEMKKIFNSLYSTDERKLISVYQNSPSVRRLWGTPCHYISFIKMEE